METAIQEKKNEILNQLYNIKDGIELWNETEILINDLIVTVLLSKPEVKAEVQKIVMNEMQEKERYFKLEFTF